MHTFNNNYLPMKRILTLSAVIIGIAMLGACDPSYMTYWYIENQLGEDIIVTRSDSSEIHNVFIHNGNIGCIFQVGSLGGASFYMLEHSFSDPHNPDTLIILSTSYDTLYRLYPEHYSKPYPNEDVAINRHFWNRDNWTDNADHKKLTISWYYILTPDSL